MSCREKLKLKHPEKINEEIKRATVKDDGPRVLDSGARRHFESGAVRDICAGKGRCDLLPLDVIGGGCLRLDPDSTRGKIFNAIDAFQRTGITEFLYTVLYAHPFSDDATMILEVSKQFEDGAAKYGDNNWRKGIPVRCYIDSATRHYLKFLRGDKDEPHDRAFCWNIMCAIWTCIHHPELNEYMKDEGTVAEEE